MFKKISATVLSLAMVFLLAGCGGGDKADDAAKAEAAGQVKTEHPTAEHPKAEHPAAEHPTTEHPHGDEADSAAVKSEHPNSDHPN